MGMKEESSRVEERKRSRGSNNNSYGHREGNLLNQRANEPMDVHSNLD